MGNLRRNCAALAQLLSERTGSELSYAASFTEDGVTVSSLRIPLEVRLSACARALRSLAHAHRDTLTNSRVSRTTPRAFVAPFGRRGARAAVVAKPRRRAAAPSPRPRLCAGVAVHRPKFAGGGTCTACLHMCRARHRMGRLDSLWSVNQPPGRSRPRQRVESGPARAASRAPCQSPSQRTAPTPAPLSSRCSTTRQGAPSGACAILAVRVDAPQTPRAGAPRAHDDATAAGWHLGRGACGRALSLPGGCHDARPGRFPAAWQGQGVEPRPRRRPSGGHEKGWAS
eukprot:scaffold1117_cov379-Prasinococcus_capsulatus_cf.AAC.13